MSGLRVLVPADIRFPLERANGIQIVKTAAALGRAGARTTLLVRQSDPRATPDILRLYGVAAGDGLEIRRVRVLHRKGAYLVPRATFLARAGAAAVAALSGGAVVFTRDLQLADVLLRLPGVPRRVVYEAHAVEWLLYGERGALYGTGERPRPAKARRLRAREERVWKGAAAFVATTAGIRDSFAEAFGPRARSTRVVPNGCDVPLGQSFPALPEDTPPRVLYAGQLYPWKGVDVLLEAVSRVPELRLVVVGGLEGEPDLLRLQALAERLALRERVEFKGTVPPAEVARELARAAVVAVPFLHTAMTERHTSPLKAFEAMAAGRPVVASDLPSTREVLRHGETAWLVPPGDPGALADALRRLVADRGLAGRLAGAAYAEAPRYSWDARGHTLFGVLQEVA